MPTSMASKFKKAADELRAFKSADEIADHLRACGIKGWRANPWHCPISNYLRSKTGPVDTYQISSSGGIGLKYRWLSGEVVIPATNAVAEFIHRFDKSSSKYQDLAE